MDDLQNLDAGETLVIGAGLAGLFTALRLAPRRATVLSPEPVGSDASSAWAQAGIAAALDEADSPASHARDTESVGAGIVNATLARSVAAEAPARIRDLVELGTRFDRDSEDRLVLSREAGHSHPRVAGVASDSAGREIMLALAAAAERTDSVRIIEGLSAVALARSEDRVCGVYVRTQRAPDSGPIFISADTTVLAAGGLCGLYATTTSPAGIRGQALGMAARAGAVAADVEFIQFHPTAIAVDRDPRPLATEALRGAGATLVDADGRRFMEGVHPDLELAPRDIVAREIFRLREAGGEAFLDARAIFSATDGTFPNVAQNCRDCGIDPARQLIPVTPAAHFHIGGVRSDTRGRTSLPGLYVCGEAAATGLHGGNRLGSNSLLEATVFANRIAEELSGAAPASRTGRPVPPPPSGSGGRDGEAESIDFLRRLMSARVGVVRDHERLSKALAKLNQLESGSSPSPASESWRNMIAAATLVTAAAWRRRESRGVHWREDFPETGESSTTPREITLAEAVALRNRCADCPE